jgi:methionyl-tRNA formyltransferase
VKPESVRVLFFGSPAFAVPSLRALADAGFRLVGAVTQPDRPAGRGAALRPPNVKTAALELLLPVFQPETLRDPEVQARLAAFEADVFLVAAYGKILPRAVLELPSRGCLNVHGSLLPRWRGPSPITAAILAGDAETGVSIMELVRKMDAGPVIGRAAIPIGPDDTTGSLEPRLAELGAKTLVELLPGWYDGVIPAVPQDESLVTYCALLTKADGHLPATMTAAEAERAVRAYNPWPGAFVLYRGERLGIWKAHIAEAPVGAVPGDMVILDRQPACVFGDGVLVLNEVQKPGGKRLTGQQFLAGERGKLEAQFT